jgi:DHA2 family multidrug resistance protein-like MFS transporter
MNQKNNEICFDENSEIRAGKKEWFGLFTVLALVLLVAMDGSVLYLAMPKITSAILPTADQSLWILDIYGFVVGSLLVAFGNIGDHYGRLKLIICGAITFGIGSTTAALSTSSEMLIISRAVMGLGGATLLPSGLAILSNLFLNPKQRS